MVSNISLAFLLLKANTPWPQGDKRPASKQNKKSSYPYFLTELNGHTVDGLFPLNRNTKLLDVISRWPTFFTLPLQSMLKTCKTTDDQEPLNVSRERDGIMASRVRMQAAPTASLTLNPGGGSPSFILHSVQPIATTTTTKTLHRSTGNVTGGCRKQN